MGSTEAPKITLYTSLGCPWAHRSQIALSELGLKYDTKIVDLSVPRTPEYLAINPRGTVPSLIYDGEALTESGVITQFLVDAHPSHLEKASNEEGGALQRARYNFFIDTFNTKFIQLFFGIAKTKSEQERDQAAERLVDSVVKEIEPLVKDASPFFGGSSKLTYVEVQCASFLIRLLTFGRHEILFPKRILPSLETEAPAFWKWANAAIQENSVTYVWNKKAMVDGMIARVKQAIAAAQKAAQTAPSL